MKKLISLLVVLVMLVAISPAVFAEEYPVGSLYNMAILELGENTVEIAENPEGIVELDYFYVWGTEVAGTFTIDFADEGEGTPFCQIYVNEMPIEEIISEKGGSISVELPAYTMIYVEIGEWNYQAATFNFTASFVPSEEVGGGEVTGTLENPIVIDTMPVTLEGIFDDNADVYYKFVPETDGILDVAVFEGCMVLVMTDGGENVAELPATLTAGDEVIINLWYFAGGAAYTATFSYEEVAAETVEHTFDSLVDVDTGSIEDKAEIPAGTTFADGFFTVVGTMTQRYQESKGGIYAVEIAKNGTGALQFTTNGTATVTFVVSSTGGSNTSAVALINVNTQEVMTNVEGLTEVTSTSQTTLTYENLPAGTYQLVSPESDYNRGFRLMTVNVVETVAAACAHEYTSMEYDYCYDEYYLYDLVEMCADCGEILGRYVPGTLENPMEIPGENIQYNDDYSEMYATVTVPAGQSIWFGIRNVSGMELFINGEFYGILEPANPWDMWAPCAFLLTNDTDADVTYELLISWPLGTEYNPDELPMNDSFELFLAADSYEYVYQWIATEDGELTLVVDGDFWTYRVNMFSDPEDWSSYVYGDTFYFTYGDANTTTVSVKAGDTVTVFLGSLNIVGEGWDAEWLVPETTLTVTTTFVPAGGEVGCAHKNLVHMDAVEPACHFNGNIEYWVCYDCECVWADEALTQVTNIKNVILPALGGEVIHVAAKAPSCYEEGNIEHWYCESCEQVWQDEALTQLTNHMNVKLGAAHTNLVHMDAVEPGCHFAGNIEYWVCYDCGGVWQDEALTQVTNIKNVIVPALGGDVIHVEAKAPSCYEEGNIEHWYCEKCEQVWQDEALTQLTNHMNVKIAAAHTNLVHMDAVEPGCHFAGNIEYWVCYDCGSVWQDEALTQVTNIKNVVVPALGGEVIHVEAKAPTCTENGNIEHWYCEKCEQVWQDEALTQLTNHMNVKLGATGHNYVDGVCANCGENDQNVPGTGDMFGILFAVIAVAGLGIVALPKKKEN